MQCIIKQLITINAVEDVTPALNDYFQTDFQIEIDYKGVTWIDR